MSNTFNPSTYHTIGVIGSGTMGKGIAQLLIQRQHTVLFFDQNQGALSQAKNDIESILAKLVSRQKITQHEADQSINRLQLANNLDQMADANLVIEAIIENLAAKQGLFTQLETICSSKTIFATNTSTLSVNAIANGLTRPQKLIGIHFFNPVPIMKLVEVIYGIQTNSKLIDEMTKLVTSWGKKTVICKSTPGFIVNRVARPFYAEALEIMETFNLPAPIIDTLVKDNLQFKMGPFELMDLIGNDVNYLNTSSVFEAMYYDKRFKPSQIQKEYVEAGLLGRKTKQGFYNYEQSQLTPNTSLSNYIKPARKLQTGINLAVYLPDDMQPNGLFASLWQTIQQADGGNGQSWQVITESSLINKHIPYIEIDNTICLIDQAATAAELCQLPQQAICSLDWAYDYRTVSYLSCYSLDANHRVNQHVIDLFAFVNIGLMEFPYMPGLINGRILAMILNEAADALWHKVCSEQDVDIAILFGLNYPLGPISWAEQIGWQQVQKIISNMASFYELERYRVSPWIKTKLLHYKP